MTAPRGRGRPRSFDPDAALAPVTDVFWRRGFDAASVDELARAAGLNKPNLYGAFGDKRAMYQAALEGFRAAMTAQLAEALPGIRPIAEELRAFFDAALALYTGAPEPRGCLIMCTAPVASVDDRELAAFVRDVTAELDFALAARLRRSGSADPDLEGPMLTALLQSLALRARAGAPVDELRRFAHGAIDRLIA